VNPTKKGDAGARFPEFLANGGAGGITALKI